MILFNSTRGGDSDVTFQSAILTGLASDGGLYIPNKIPIFTRSDIAAMSAMSYLDVFYHVIAPFTHSLFEKRELRELLTESLSHFKNKAIAPMVQLDSNLYVLELFHGPTLAFKDIALQFLGNLVPRLIGSDSRAIVLGATSGDTGAAALSGFAKAQNMSQFILYPHQKVSAIQRLQMTTLPASNIHCIAVEGSFDDCQSIVKQIFKSQWAQQKQLIAINSINWARIMAQIVYYFYAATRLGSPFKAINFSVPSGNFGNVLSGYYARCMGLPMQTLMVATNSNDILHRCIQNNDYSLNQIQQTIAPSMDITVSSNFERVVFDLCARDGPRCNFLMEQLQSEGKLTLNKYEWHQFKTTFSSCSVSEPEICRTIEKFYRNNNYLLDTHSAVGVCAAQTMEQNIPVVCLGTAHPSKFAAAIGPVVGLEDQRLHRLDNLQKLDERFTVLPAQVKTIRDFIDERH